LSVFSRSTLKNGEFLLCIALLSGFIFFSGCTKRQLATPTSQMEIEKKFWVRVLLLDDIKDCSFNADSAVRLIDAETEDIQARFIDQAVGLHLAISDGKIVIDGKVFESRQLIIFPEEPYIFNLNGDDYRGKLQLIVDPNGDSFDAVNLVPIESYLAGVISAEMPQYWESEALKAQAIASRTYSLYVKRRFGPNRHWDVKKTQANQVYKGVKAESNLIWDIIGQTQGQVLTCKGPDGSEDIFPTYYSSICGGHTENSQNVFGGDFFEPLCGVPCPYCREVAKPKFFYWPVEQFDKTEVSEKLVNSYSSLKEIGKIESIVPQRQSDYDGFSRLTSVKLIGENGKSDFIRAEDLRLAIDPTGRRLKSAICKIAEKVDNTDNTNKWVFSSGRGYGHGVGMCQCGAQAMARRGKTAKQILKYYYPGSKIVSVYKND